MNASHLPSAHGRVVSGLSCSPADVLADATADAAADAGADAAAGAAADLCWSACLACFLLGFSPLLRFWKTSSLSSAKSTVAKEAAPWMSAAAGEEDAMSPAVTNARRTWGSVPPCHWTRRTSIRDRKRPDVASAQMMNELSAASQPQNQPPRTSCHPSELYVLIRQKTAMLGMHVPSCSALTL